MELTGCDGCGGAWGVVRADFEGVGRYGRARLFLMLCTSCAEGLPGVLDELGVLAMTAGACIPAEGRPAPARTRLAP